ncbi:calmodulin-like [Octopus sinensis]|uniref:Calmodulin-like n=1 Tax=Octopus sinensis TaxID=2607531 RepID=A0A6P7U9E0_9MOLL|nr:calmodulin-like [Octopus sinensis]XP_029657983.1 calmodulin-like [Octopus sinensis]
MTNVSQQSPVSDYFVEEELQCEFLKFSTQGFDRISNYIPPKNGVVKFPDLVFALQSLDRKPEKIREILAAFRVIDKEGDGFIQTDLLRHVLTTVGEEYNADEIGTFLKVTEPDVDGNLDYIEFVKKFHPIPRPTS